MVAKVVTKICNFLISIILIVLIVAAASLTVPRLFGYDMLAVLSGSMEPYYHVGSVVYVNKNVKPEEIQVGDPITFYISEGTVATHRVVEIDQNNKLFTTKGDANEIVDLAPVAFSNFIGKATISIPYLGYITVNIKTPKGMFGAVAVLVVLIILYLIPEILKPEDPKEKEAIAQKKAEKEAKKAAKKQQKD